MRIFFAACLFLFLGLGATAQNDWENPAVIGKNKLEPRATMYSFASESAALTYDRERSDRVLSLNGSWDFNFSTKVDEVPQDFLAPAFDDWQPIRVPTNWEMQGFGQRIYTNSKHPWGHKNWPLISPMDNPVGIYRKKFTVPEGWNGMDVRIHFGGVTSAFYLYVNGAEVGYSQGSRTPAEFDLTPYLAPGENTVILKVFRWSDGSYLESQDGWRLSGIHRDVLLLAEPKAKITDFTVRTELDAKYEDAVLAISPEVSIPAGEDPDAYRINAALYDDGSLVKETSISAKARTNFWYNQRFAPVFDLINLAVENPKKWSAEYPNLYTLVLSLRRADGTVVEAKSTRVGFRKFETHGGVLTVNGQAIKLYGVNRHDHNAKTGKTVSYADMRGDLELLKRYNFNAVRCSHYPNNSAFYDLCDEYGIYVIDEANVETHGVRGGGGELASHPAWTSAFVDRAVRMYERDKNHPSIFSWSLGNESGVGANHSAMAGYLKWKDPERLIHFEPAGSGGGKLSPQSRNTPADPHDFTDMISRMYPTPREFMEMDASQIGAKPVISCEYTHAMGNSNGGLKMIWDIIHASKRIAGGFIWDWMDQGILAEEDGCEQYVYGGYFGEPINDGNFCLNGIINSDQTVKPVMYECKYVFQPFTFTKFDPRRGNFLITNRTAFTHSEAYDFTYEVLADGKSVATGNFADLKLAGGASAPVKIPAVESTTGREYFLNVYAKQKEATTWSEPGYVVASEQFALVPPPAPAAAPDFMTDTPPLKAANEGGRYVVSGPGFTVAFDRETGYLTELKKRGAYVITGPVRPNFWRAVTDNDRAVIRNKPGIKIWQEATVDQQLRDFTTEETDRGTFLVKTTYRLANTDLTYHLRYTIRPDGTIAVDNDFIAPNGLDNLPRVGLSLGLAENLTQIEWYGKGPHENYVDRNASAFVGRYQTDLAGLGTEFVYPQANANRTEVRWASFTDGTGTGLQVSGNFEFSAYEQTLDNLDAATYRCELTKADAITLNLDHKQQGVGGYNSWSLKAAPLPEHSVLSQRYTFSFTLR